jgi:hypothetical protein
MFCTGHLERGAECHELRCRSHLYMPSANVVDRDDCTTCATCFGPAEPVLQCSRCFRVIEETYGRTKRTVNERCGAKLEYDEAEVIAASSSSDEEADRPRVWAKRASAKRPPRVIEDTDDDSSLELFA